MKLHDSYRTFTIDKATGGSRDISAPMPELASCQRWILRNILDRIPVHPAAHGFVKGRSTVTAASRHVGRAVVVSVDIKGFFPSITFRRVRGIFRGLFNDRDATLLSLLCTENVQPIGRTGYARAMSRALPQGSPCSPALSNVACHRMDARLNGLATHLSFAYTRYADDMTFSGDNSHHVPRLLKQASRIITEEGFTVHPKKTKVMHAHQRQQLLGIVVNGKLSLPREVWHAMLEALATQPMNASLRGRLSYAMMVSG